MRFPPRRPLLLWLVPLLLTSTDALAWGLYTHVYFAQLLLWAIPLADPALRRLARRHPRLVMAGACLPDVALTARSAGADRLGTSHHWPQLHALMDAARTDAERAVVLGYASHLMADIIAHNHFVPAHERLWFESDLTTHVAVEWAMDHHVGGHLFARPGPLLHSEREALVPLMSRAFHTHPEQVGQALATLAQGETWLRASRLHGGLYHLARFVDRRVRRRFNLYLAHTSRRLGQLDRLMEGHLPSWAAEVEPVAARARLTDAPRRLLRACLPLPEDFFAGACRRHPVGEIVLPDLPQGDDAGPASALLRPPGAALLSQPL
ncbi:MAG TPA: zinc dependent phospholipase C family protein [Zoogloea sp.]|uniref:zinc dependent phospholipase C family protein n=1 Tax=Zoogloea sp. TaxID=49181 RepID=UPI002BE58A0F|nr:zinc dependent phospholipase C family protein [Zoogloea sp.]HMV17654.1 zinc dependent phospholipase C family protein [Rhodocyclaceae bacterium]HMV62564.1 zinc dependent phospholipase C family protein [Rhodocyclaceae bacterium]HMY49579.1 zinc dependent phospholipase C family protein [Rhodocyclaceae bacterium]HNA68198.1 zinc dependent phospholipase C family protein [Rhodocyclaceae bacterium]HNC79519.1 zinc dependent phospholipase C family protein [Rhodocyclaceae bacterium]